MRCALLIFLFLTFVVNAQRSDFAEIDFKKADSIALVYKGKSLDNLLILSHQLTANLTTEVEKFRAIYTWVCTNIENDYSAYVKTSKKRKKLARDKKAFMEWNNKITPKVFERLRKERKTACTGYAYLLKEMASLAGLQCNIINGYGRTPTLRLQKDSPPNHSWNRIKLNNHWYLCDATWSAGKIIIEDDIAKFESDYFDGYFLATPTLFAKNHYPLEKEAFLLANPPDFNEFIAGPVVYKEAFSNGIIPQLPKQMHLTILKGKTISFQITIPEDAELKEVKLLANNGVQTTVLKPDITSIKNELTLTTRFNKAGLFDVHLQIANELLATYVVKVKRK